MSPETGGLTVLSEELLMILLLRCTAHVEERYDDEY